MPSAGGLACQISAAPAGMSRADEGRRWRTLRWKPTKEAAPAGPWAQEYKGYQQMVLSESPPTSEGQLRGFVAQSLSPV